MSNADAQSPIADLLDSLIRRIGRAVAWVHLLLIGVILVQGDSFRLNESSESPAGLPYRWLIKAVIPISFGLLFMAALARLLRAWAALRNEG